MAREDRPSMPWYVRDWLTSESRDRMTFEARGVYFDMLCKAWLDHGLTTNHVVLARALGLTPAKFAALWTIVGPSWHEENGRLVNSKQEEVRTELNAFKANKSAAGKQSAASKAANKLATDGQQTNQQSANSKPTEGQPSSSSSSSSSKEILEKEQIRTSDDVPVTISASSSPLIISPIQFEKAKKSFAFYGSRLKVPHVLHVELRDKLGGESPDGALLVWYFELNAEAEESREPIADVFEWLRPKFVAWATAAVFDAEIAKMQPRGAR